MNNLRVIGDVHGKFERYLEIASDAPYSLQLGDMGFDYRKLDALGAVTHRFFGGNHDNYDIYHHNPYSIGDFGIHTIGDVKFFFVRGAYSIDMHIRLENYMHTGVKSWWKNEQLDEYNRASVLACYDVEKPDIVITHTCPQQVARLIGNPGVLLHYGHDPLTFTTNTQTLLEKCFEIHQPKLWIYGHFHQDRVDCIGDTTFRCLSELGYVDINSEGDVI